MFMLIVTNNNIVKRKPKYSYKFTTLIKNFQVIARSSKALQLI